MRQVVSKTRQSAAFDPIGQPRVPIVTFKRDYPHGYVYPAHFHDRDQVVYASSGVLTVRTSQGIWVVPVPRAVWIPAKTPHEVRMSGHVALRTLYLKMGIAGKLPRNCCVLNVSPFLRELITYACEFPTLTANVKEESHLISVILDQMKQVRTIPLQLPHPQDSRAIHVAETLIQNPGDERSTEEICRMAGGSKRTIERIFQHETGMSLGRWRQQLRLLHAMQLLAQGEKIANAALGAGYSRPSAFISSFKRALGTTPTQYFDSMQQSPDRMQEQRRHPIML